MCVFDPETLKTMTPEQIQAAVDAQNAANGATPTDADLAGRTKTGIAGGGDRGMETTALDEGLNPDTGFNDGISRDAGGQPKPTPGQGVAGNTPSATGNDQKTYDPNGAWDPNAFLNARGDVLAEYNRLIATADKNSPWYTEHGLDGGAAGFATWYANQNGINTSGTARAGASGGAGTGADGAAQQQNDLITSLTNGFNDQIKALQTGNQAQIDQITQLNTNLTTALGQQGKDFAKSQQDLLDGMQRSAAEQSAKFAGALKDLQTAGNANGQAAKKPNYGRALARNKELNSTGLSSTMLTGPGGVTPGAGGGQLGMTSLLGA